MRQETQIALAKEVFRLIENETTDAGDDLMYLSTSVYTSPDRLAVERERLFLERPLLMGLSCDLPEAGSLKTDDYTGVPILLVRDLTGKVRAYLNACKHRGARLISEPCEARKLISCPYHGWTYDISGKLVSIPHKEYFDGFDVDGCQLTELPVAENNGLIWVRASGDTAIDAEAHLEGLADELTSYGFEDYHFYERRLMRCEMSWKIVIDTFLEPYHFAVLHRTTVGQIFYPNICLVHKFGCHLRESLPRQTILNLRSQPESDWDFVDQTAIIYVLFPNTVLVMQRDHAEIWRVFPVGNDPARSVVELSFYIPEPAVTEKARAHWDANMDLTVRTVEDEDFPTGEGAQRNFATGRQSHIVFGRNEPALAYFEQQVNVAVGA